MSRSVNSLFGGYGFKVLTINEYYTYPENDKVLVDIQVRELLESHDDHLFAGEITAYIDDKGNKFAHFRGVIKEQDEERFDKIIKENNMEQPLHLSIGQEYIIAGVTRDADTNVISSEDAKNVDLNDLGVEEDIVTANELEYVMGLFNGAAPLVDFEPTPECDSWVYLFFKVDSDRAKILKDMLSDRTLGQDIEDKMKEASLSFIVNECKIELKDAVIQEDIQYPCPAEIVDGETYIYGFGFKVKPMYESKNENTIKRYNDNGVNYTVSEYDADVVVRRALYHEDDKATASYRTYKVLGGLSCIETQEIKLMNNVPIAFCSFSKEKKE